MDHINTSLDWFVGRSKCSNEHVVLNTTDKKEAHNCHNTDPGDSFTGAFPVKGSQSTLIHLVQNFKCGPGVDRDVAVIQVENWDKSEEPFEVITNHNSMFADNHKHLHSDWRYTPKSKIENSDEDTRDTIIRKEEVQRVNEQRVSQTEADKQALHVGCVYFEHADRVNGQYRGNSMCQHINDIMGEPVGNLRPSTDHDLVLDRHLFLFEQGLDQSVAHHHITNCEPDTAQKAHTCFDINLPLQAEGKLSLLEIESEIRVVKLVSHN